MLEISDVDAYRGTAHILHKLSLAVGEREVVCLVGRNGAGKTTTLETIMGFLPARSGRVVFHGEDVTRLPPHQRARRGIGYAPEDCGIFPELTVAEMMLMASWLAGPTGRAGVAGAEERVFQIFPEVREIMGREGLKMSGGQKKMVAIARAMALSPSLLILDEAFEGLAPVVVKRFRDAVMKIKDMGVAILIAESNLATASRVADRLYAIDRGEIIFHGDPKDALADANVMKALKG
jgi:branched-chain amino acid transport system ATP-binding protein